MTVNLAAVNASLGIQGTLYLLLRSPGYDLLSPWALSRAREIQALGQHLAFRCALPPTIPTDEAELASLVRTDFDLVQHHLPKIQPVFAWHSSTPELIRRGLLLEVPGLVNVYRKRFFEDIPHYSDSNSRYSVAEFEGIIREATEPAVYLLFFPLYWVTGGSSLVEIWAGTWEHIVREREHEMRLNSFYSRHFPQGIPTDILKQLAASKPEAG